MPVKHFNYDETMTMTKAFQFYQERILQETFHLGMQVFLSSPPWLWYLWRRNNKQEKIQQTLQYNPE